MNTIRPHRPFRSLIALLVAPVAALTSLAFAGPASAASVGAFNIANCNPNNRTIEQQVEVYRDNAQQQIALQAALVNKATGAVSYSNVALGKGGTAYALFNWRNVNRGSYNVFYIWAVYNRSTGRWTWAQQWVQVKPAQVLTYGTPTYPGSELFIGAQQGVCTI